MQKDRILIVDDQVEILNAIERLLKNEFKTYTAQNGEQGLEILKRHTIRLPASAI